MKPVTVAAVVSAPPDRVFDVIVDIETLPETSPDTVEVRFVTEQRSGPGTKFVDVRRMGKQTQEFPLELTECDRDARTARFVSDHDGTIWDTTMRVVAQGDGTHVSFTMDAINDSKMKQFLFTLMRGLFRRGMQKQVDALKAYCERG